MRVWLLILVLGGATATVATPAAAQQVCVREPNGQVVCGDALQLDDDDDDEAPRYLPEPPYAPYTAPRRGYGYGYGYGYPPLYRGATRIEDCPQGLVPDGRGGCRQWYPTRGSECPPGFTLQRGHCRPYRGY